jgi:flagellar motor switch protein FliN/FliY
VKNQLQPNRDSNLYKFFDLFGEVFSNSVGTIISKPLIYEVADIFESDAETVENESKGKAGIYFSDKGNSVNGLLIFDIKLITAFADIMLMGEGNGADDLNPDLIDAVKELASQGVSAVNVPFQEKFGTKISFEVTKVEKIEKITIDSDLLVQNYKISYDNNEEVYQLVISDSIKNILGKEQENTQDNDFDFDDMPGFEDTPKKSSNSFAQSYDGNIEMLLDVEIPVSVRIGSTKMFLKDIVGIGPGNIIELDNYADEPIELLVNNKPIARGEVVIVDGFFGIRIKEIISREERLKKLRDA